IPLKIDTYPPLSRRKAANSLIPSEIPDDSELPPSPVSGRSDQIDIPDETPGTYYSEEHRKDDDYEEEGYEDYDEDFEDFVVDSEPLDDLAYNPPPADIGAVGAWQGGHPLRRLNDRSNDSPSPSKVQKALEAENERASSAQERRDKEMNVYAAKRERMGSELPQRQVVDLVHSHKQAQKAKKASHAGERSAKRAKDLQNLIELDICVYEIFDLAPMNEYELYIRSFGSSNAVQVATQSNEDTIDQEMQTDDWDVEDKWVQIPPEQFTDVGTGTPDLPWMSVDDEKEGIGKDRRSGKKAVKGGGGAGRAEGSDGRGLLAIGVDSLGLVKFLRKASQVMDSLLEENVDHSGLPRSFSSERPLPISEGNTTLGRPSFLQGRVVTDICYSSTDHNLLIMAWSLRSGVEADKKTPLDDKGIVCLWRLTDPTVPYRLLVCEGKPTTVCFSPTKPHLVFAGTNSGSIQAWDIQESTTTVLRTPCYSTDGIHTMKRAHEEPIRRILALHRYRGRDGDRVTGLEGESFQIASIDEAGVMQLWVILELLEESIASSELDFGMKIGGKLKLIRSSGLTISNPERTSLLPDVRVQECRFQPNSTDRFIAATTLPMLLHGSRFQDRCTPRVYRSRSPPPSGIPPPLDGATTLDFSPYENDIFLAGHFSGSISLFSTREERALTVWNAPKARGAQGAPAGVSCVRWSPHRPAVFYVLDDAGTLYVWDLLESEGMPTHIIETAGGPKGKIIGIAVGPLAGGGVGAGGKGRPTLALAYEGGGVDVHWLDISLGEQIGEEEMFEAFLMALGFLKQTS
ncbi:WD40-repeat-containing domain protein, partial [Blyttiomyces helicus]